MLNSFRLFVLVVLFVALGAPSALAEGKKYAVLVGVNDYQHDNLPTLKFAERDAAELAKVLEPAGYSVTLLSSSVKADDRKPTKANIEKQLKAVLNGAMKGDTILIALSGHGMQFEEQRDAFFCPLDARPFKDETKTLVSLGELYQDMEKSFAGMKVLLVDACRNDPGARGRSGVNGDNAPRPPQGVAALFSCKAGERAFENDKLQHGVFFHHVLEGLRGKAVTDGEVTFAGLANYVSRRVAKDVPELIGGGAKQSPNLKADYSIEPVLLTVKTEITKVDPKINSNVVAPAKKDIAKVEPKVDSATRKPGEEIEVTIAKGVKMKFCWIPPGKALLGSPMTESDRRDNEPEHEFTTNGFWFSKYEVTQGEWQALMGSNPSYFSKSGSGKAKLSRLDTNRFPVEQVEWNDCQSFLKKLNTTANPPSELSQSKFVLPQEDEWEYACRGGKGNKQAFYFGNELNGTQANSDGSRPYGTTTKGPNLERTTTVGSYENVAPHPWGLCDMHGNAWEWCEDWYDNERKFHVLRGGSWNYFAKVCRAAFRYDGNPNFRYYDLYSFRVVFRP